MIRGALVALALAGCTGGVDPDTPAWALDTITLDPGPTGPVGLQAWTLHDARWGRRPTPAALVCSVLVRLDAAREVAGCEACTHAWRFSSVEVVDTDCSDPSLPDLPLLTATEGVGLGPLPDDLQADAPSPDAVGGFVFLVDRWLPHGHAVFAGEGTAEADGWDGVRPATLTSGWAWDLTTTSGPDRDTDVAVPAP